MRLPARFGRYVLEERLGAGGMAEVYRARIDDPGFPKPVCVKRVLPQLSAQPGFADMMRDEARIAAHLNHQNLVQSLDFGDVDGVLYMVMELVDGANLQEVLEAHQVHGEELPLSQALHIAVCVSRALAHAHAATSNGKALSIVHRDVSPQNVLLGLDGAVKLADFGVARASERLAHTTTGEAKGKPAYMAPEQVTAEPVDHRADQFALGIVLWEMIAGRRLFVGASVLAVMDAVANLPLPLLSSQRAGVPPSLDAVVGRMLARPPDQRFRDMLAVERALTVELARLHASPTDVDPRRLVALVRETAEDTVRMPARRVEAEHTLEETAPQPAMIAPYRNARAPGGSADRTSPAPGGAPLAAPGGEGRGAHPLGAAAVGVLLGVVITATVGALVAGESSPPSQSTVTPAGRPSAPVAARGAASPVAAPVEVAPIAGAPVAGAPVAAAPIAAAPVAAAPVAAASVEAARAAPPMDGSADTPVDRPGRVQAPATDVPRPVSATSKGAGKLEQATGLFLRGDFAAAIPLLEAHLKAQPDDAQARRLLDMATRRVAQ